MDLVPNLMATQLPLESEKKSKLHLATQTYGINKNHIRICIIMNV